MTAVGGVDAVEVPTVEVARSGEPVIVQSWSFARAAV
jgi:hypothetical protein